MGIKGLSSDASLDASLVSDLRVIQGRYPTCTIARDRHPFGI